MIQKHGHAFKETDRCCYNCKHILWLIGVGQGLRCGYKMQDGVKPPTIPGISYVCENFKGKGTTEWSCKCKKCSPEINDWTLGSGNITPPKTTLDKKSLKKLKEECEKASQISMKAAQNAVEQYAKTMKNFMENPNDWTNPNRSNK